MHLQLFKKVQKQINKQTKTKLKQFHSQTFLCIKNKKF